MNAQSSPYFIKSIYFVLYFNHRDTEFTERWFFLFIKKIFAIVEYDLFYLSIF